MNMSENNQTERQFGWTEERFRQLIESVKDYAIFVTDLEGRIETWNIGAERIFGYTADEIIGKSGAILFSPDERDEDFQARARLEMKTAREQGYAEDETWHVRKDGSLFYASGISTPLYENGKLTGYAKIARDLTERVTLEDELRDERDNLEIKVESRTSDLKEANESLRMEGIELLKSEAMRSKLLHQIITTQEEERKRIARDLHDHLGQHLTALRMQLAILKDKCEKDTELCQQIEKAQDYAQRVDSEIDFLAWELRPTVLDDLGLVVALENYVKEWSRHYKIPAEFHSSKVGKKRLPSDVETNLYRIAQEALNNVSKHARAKQVSVLLERPNKELILIIEDDGIGFEPKKKQKITENDRGMGLLGMKERAALIGGNVEIESKPGAGCSIYVRVPIKITGKAKT